MESDRPGNTKVNTRLPTQIARERVHLVIGVVTFGHVTEMAVTPFDPP